MENERWLTLWLLFIRTNKKLSVPYDIIPCCVFMTFLQVKHNLEIIYETIDSSYDTRTHYALTHLHTHTHRVLYYSASHWFAQGLICKECRTDNISKSFPKYYANHYTMVKQILIFIIVFSMLRRTDKTLYTNKYYTEIWSIKSELHHVHYISHTITNSMSFSAYYCLFMFLTSIKLKYAEKIPLNKKKLTHLSLSLNIIW